MTKTQIKSNIMGILHSTVFPLALAFGFDNIIYAVFWWLFVFFIYETNEGSKRPGKYIFYILTTICLFVISLAIYTQGV